MKFLTKIGAYHVNREDGTEGFTRGGILMLGKTESITDQSCAPQYFVDYQEKLSPDPMLRWTDRLYPDGTWEANLFQFFYRTYGKLSQLLPTPFMLKGIDRQEESTAHVALREALANTLIHCNYAQQGNILVVGRRESITMRNPGCMLISMADFYAGSHSICRNPTLQKLFMFLGNGEKAGSGADIIRKGWNDNHWPAPELSERTQPDETMMTLQLVCDEKRQENKHDVGENVGDDDPTELTKRQRLIINELRKSPTISAKIMSERMSVSPRTIERDLQKLTAMGVITHEGSDFGGEWKVLINVPEYD